MVFKEKKKRCASNLFVMTQYKMADNIYSIRSYWRVSFYQRSCLKLSENHLTVNLAKWSSDNTSHGQKELLSQLYWTPSDIYKNICMNKNSTGSLVFSSITK